MKKIYFYWTLLLMLSACSFGQFSQDQPLEPVDSDNSTGTKPSSHSLIYGEIVRESDPKQAFVKLATAIEHDSQVAGICHNIVHAIGHAAFDKYGFEGAMSYADDICGSGYMHGVTEKYISAQDDPLVVMKSACPESYGACFHGIGHGLLMFYNYELNESLNGCDQFSQLSEQVQCSEGVFMENFTVDLNMHKNVNLDPVHPLDLCADQTDLYKSACYFYGPRYFLTAHPTDFAGLFKLCQDVVPPYDGQCMRGAGSSIMKYHISDIPGNIALCQQAPTNLQPDCFSGLTSYYLIHLSSVEKTEELCESFPEDFQAVCQATVDGSASFFDH